MDHWAALVFRSIVRKDRFNSYAMGFIERQHPVFEHVCRRFRALAGVKLGKSEPAVPAAFSSRRRRRLYLVSIPPLIQTLRRVVGQITTPSSAY